MVPYVHLRQQAEQTRVLMKTDELTVQIALGKRINTQSLFQTYIRVISANSSFLTSNSYNPGQNRWDIKVINP